MNSHFPLRFIAFATAGAAFLSTTLRVPAQSSPSLTLQLTNGSARLNVIGDAASPCVIQYTTNASAGAWTTLTNCTLFGGAALAVDAAALTNSARFYRATIIVPTNMIWIRAGSFVMGSPTNEAARDADETQHAVVLTNGFFIGKYLVTQGAYFSLINTNPSYFSTNHGFTQDLNLPVETVTWYDASNYCEELTIQQQASGQIQSNWFYRLPTESEWEFACRAGTTTPFYYGGNLTSGMANFDGNYGYVAGIGTTNNPGGIFLNRTADVGSYQANAWDLYDMAGNVWEWCEDWYGAYPTGSATNPVGAATGTERVFRGGSMNATAAECRSADRDSYLPTSGFNTVGFRVLLTPGP